MNRLLACATICATILAGLTAPTMADPTTDDVHCLIVEIQMVASPDEALRRTATIGHFYWLGKLAGRTPDLDLESRILTELPKLTGDYFNTEASRCGDELKARGAAESAMGKDMQQKGADLMKRENTP